MKFLLISAQYYGQQKKIPGKLTSPYRSDSWNIRNMPAHAWSVTITGAMCLRFSPSFPFEHIKQNRDASKGEVYFFIIHLYVDELIRTIHVHFACKDWYQRNISIKYKIIYWHLLFMYDTFDLTKMDDCCCMPFKSHWLDIYIISYCSEKLLCLYYCWSWICQPNSTCMVWTEWNWNS